MNINLLLDPTHFWRTIMIPFLFMILLAGCISPVSDISESTPTVITPRLPTTTPIPTSTPEWIEVQTRPTDGMMMVYVPAGEFEMGSQFDKFARPVHTVAVDAFWIDQTEVTNAMFSDFLNQEGNQVEDGVSWLEPGAGHRGIVYGYILENDGVFLPSSGYENYPVVEVSWYGSAAYCSWAGGRLPSEAEWEYAARGPESLQYPWGNTFDGTRANYCDVNCNYDWRDRTTDDGSVRWTSVGSYPEGASWCGALDMAGNVWEWVADWWSENYYARSPTNNPEGPDTGTLRIARGGSWFDEGERLNSSGRKGLQSSSFRMHWVGFRCVVPAQP
jgi:serine/threonine-protein kinase